MIVQNKDTNFARIESREINLNMSLNFSLNSQPLFGSCPGSHGPLPSKKRGWEFTLLKLMRA